MTKKEAIELIKHMSIAFVPTDQYGDYDYSQPYEEALNMAIKALQTELTHGRLIDADALYVSIAKDTYLLTDRINSRDYGMFLVGIKQKIDNAPTVQADRPHGEWVDEDGNKVPLDRDGYPLGDCYCNQCHEWLVGSDEYTIKGNFCPVCGADMRKRRET